MIEFKRKQDQLKTSYENFFWMRNLQNSQKLHEAIDELGFILAIYTIHIYILLLDYRIFSLKFLLQFW